VTVVVLTTSHHRYTHDGMLGVRGLPLRVMGYEEAWRCPKLPRATYVFTDADRLGYWELELSARLYRALRLAGCRVLNDPGRAPGRIGLLQRLKRAGLNSFGAWRLDECPADLPFPVFLRTDSAHRGVLGDLLHDRHAFDLSVAQALDQGVPARELIVVEYCAEPVREGLFHKRSMYRVGDRMVPSLGVFESHWCAKHGELGVAGEALYEAEGLALARLDDAPAIRAAFELADIEYGRADYASVRGRIEVYEINTNPRLTTDVAHPFAARRAAGEMSRKALRSAFRALSVRGQGGTVVIDDKVLRAQGRADRFVIGTPWIP